MIRNLQLLRGLAALGVVFRHTGYQIVPGISTDFFGVCVFFAISGFIMCHVTRSDNQNFILKRAVRVIPLYWLATISFFLLTNFGVFNFFYTFPTWWSLAGQGTVYLWAWFSAQAAAIVSGEAVHQLLTSLLFIPTNELPTLGVGWTLNFEILYYGLFAVSLAISARRAPLIAVAGILLTQGTSRVVSCGAICAAYGSFTLVYFAVGIAAYYIWAAFEKRAAQWRYTIVTSSFITATIVGVICIFWRTPPDAVVALVAGAVILCALIAESAGIICRNRPLLLLGDMSYSLYLMHMFIAEPMRIVGTRYSWLDQRTHVPVMLFSVGASIVLGWAVHRGIEVPMLAKLRSAFGTGTQRHAESALPWTGQRTTQ